MAKKNAEENTLMVKAETALDIATEIKTIIDAVIVAEGEITEQQYEALKTWQASLEDKAQNIAHVLTKLDHEEEYFRKLEEIAKTRRKAREAAKDRLRKYLAMCMKEAGYKAIKHNAGLFSISLVEGRLKAVVDDIGVLPQDYVTVREVYDADNQKIKDALESGIEIPGAHLERGDHYIMIR